jgi:hypothetical protein
MTDETRARFIAAIAKQVAAERVVEVHIFPAIRQGGVESGVAVIAVEREGVELAAVANEIVAVAEEEFVEVVMQEVVMQEVVMQEVVLEEVVLEEVVLEEVVLEEVVLEEVVLEEVVMQEVEIPEEVQAALDPDSPYADAAAADVSQAESEPAESEPVESEQAESEPVESEPVDIAPVVKARASRYTVYSAFYRHTLKGLERGKWEVSVTEEADAPLLTIDAVVRGVERRSGDADDTIRLSGDEFRAALPALVAQSA